MQQDRRKRARRVRESAARFAFDQPHPEQLDNGDEERFPTRIASYTKGLPHNAQGEVDGAAYDALLTAIESTEPGDFEAIPLGDPASCPSGRGRRLVNPQSGLAFDLEGPDAQALTIPPAPRFDSAQEGAEMAEVYWMALLRDVHFSDYATDATVAEAASDLSLMSDFRGPKEGGQVTPAVLFRGFTPGDLAGPYVSQFLLRDFNYGTLRVSQRQQTAKPGVDYVVDPEEWLRIQNGCDPGIARIDQLEVDGDGNPIMRYARNARDLATYVHFDALYEAYLNACLILLDSPPAEDPQGMTAPFDPGNPYVASRNQDGFGTFGPPHVLSLVCEVATRALKAVWWQKWGVHRRLRPEEFGGRVQAVRSRSADYPIDPELLESPVLDRVESQFGSYLLPLAFPEGSPVHPAYGAGHATVAGACVTVLKAWFDESTRIADLFPPVTANEAGDGLDEYTGADAGELTVGGELDKVAANVSIGRNMAGVHWRSDYTESVRLGERLAIQILQEQANTYNEDFAFTLTTFDGDPVVIDRSSGRDRGGRFEREEEAPAPT
ncbi:MAG: vanadium-dependent haloperoxidase [Actinomycetota bacterium]|nr:vanadium-dependent haloperoxidase [Actinomycetota bacterium]